MLWLKFYLRWKTRKAKAPDPRLESLLSKPWDGKILSLPHFRGCQAIPASHGICPLECTCGITTLAGHRPARLFRFALYRSKARAKYLHRFVHPVLRWRDLAGKQRRLSLWFRVLAKDAADGLRAANSLFWLDPTPEPTRENVRRSEHQEQPIASHQSTDSTVLQG